MASPNDLNLSSGDLYFINIDKYYLERQIELLLAQEAGRQEGRRIYIEEEVRSYHLRIGKYLDERKKSLGEEKIGLDKRKKNLGVRNVCLEQGREEVELEELATAEQLDYIRLGLLILRGERRRLRDKYRKKGTRSPRENLNAEAEQLRRKLRPRYHYDDEVSRHNFALQNYNLAVQNYEKDVATFLRKTWELRISQTEQSLYRARDQDKPAAILSTMLSQEIERLQCGHKNRRAEFVHA